MNKTLRKIRSFNKIVSDAKSDYTVKQAAEDAYERFLRFMPRIKVQSFLEKGGNGNGPLWYLHYNKPPTYSSYMTQDNFVLDYSAANPASPYKDLYIILGLTDDNFNSHNNRNGVFYRKGLNGRPTLVFYLFNSGLRDEDKFDADEVLRRLKYDQNVKSTFVHEFIHHHDHLRSKESKSGKGRAKYYQPEEDYKQYINHPLEFNARYMQSITNILNSFTRLLKVKENGIKGAFPTFKEFIDFYWFEPGFLPHSFKDNLSSKNKEKVIRRLYKFYDYITKDEDFTREQALRFAERQKELDAMK